MDLQQTIDLRSDAASRMPLNMLQAMSTAKVGDDVFDDDPTAHQLQNTFARLFNKQAALFFPTTIMGNTAAVLVACRPGEQILVGSKSHVVQQQCSTLAMFGGVLTRQIFSQTGLLKPQQISKMIRKRQSQVTFPDTSLVFAQNPTFGGNLYDIQELKRIRKICKQNNVHLHVDGSRIFNAIQFYKCKPSDLSDTYDSMIISLGRGLCCPFGSILLGSKQFVKTARVTRKSLGGGMRQIGVICASGLYALKYIVPQLKNDHQVAIYMGNQLSKISQVEVNVSSIKINIVYFSFKISGFCHSQFQNYLLQKNIKIRPYIQHQNRYKIMVYLQIRQKQVDKFIQATKQFFEKDKK